MLHLYRCQANGVINASGKKILCKIDAQIALQTNAYRKRKDKKMFLFVKSRKVLLRRKSLHTAILEYSPNRTVTICVVYDV